MIEIIFWDGGVGAVAVDGKGNTIQSWVEGQLYIRHLSSAGANRSFDTKRPRLQGVSKEYQKRLVKLKGS